MILARVRNKINFVLSLLQSSSLAVRRARYEELREQRRRLHPKGVSGYGYKVFSQSDEDGIINQIFARIGHTNKTFVEFGVGDGLENNTVALLYEGWSGLWIEGSSAHCEAIRTALQPALSSGQLHLLSSFATPENINQLISSKIPQQEIDLLSVDIDGNDAHVLDSINCISPRLIIAEYNAKFGASIDYCMAYDGSYGWRKSDRFGASLKHFELLLRKRGYSCVGCNVVGTNAFFVRDDLLGDHFQGPFTAEQQFEPARYELVGLSSGHPCSPDTFRTRVMRS